jgi:hypothetical protein
MKKEKCERRAIMYVRTTEGLGQVPTRYGFFAGTLGEPSVPPKIQNFLDRVKSSPQDYEAVLLISAFHVEPFSSDQLGKVLAASLENDAKDPFEEAKAIQGKVLQAMEAICKEHLKNIDFRQLFNKEKQLITVVANAFQKRIKELETKGWLEGILTDALLADYPRGLTGEVGKPFVLFNLPDEIAEQILNSRVPETHYARLGKALLLMAEQRQKNPKNAAFRQRVERERKKRGK